MAISYDTAIKKKSGFDAKMSNNEELATTNTCFIVKWT